MWHKRKTGVSQWWPSIGLYLVQVSKSLAKLGRPNCQLPIGAHSSHSTWPSSVIRILLSLHHHRCYCSGKKPRPGNLKTCRGRLFHRKCSPTCKAKLQNSREQIKRGRNRCDLGLVQDFLDLSPEAGFIAQQTPKRNWPVWVFITSMKWNHTA